MKKGKTHFPRIPVEETEAGVLTLCDKWVSSSRVRDTRGQTDPIDCKNCIRKIMKVRRP